MGESASLEGRVEEGSEGKKWKKGRKWKRRKMGEWAACDYLLLHSLVRLCKSFVEHASV